MGNTVSAAEKVAADILHTKTEQPLIPPQGHPTMSGVPPPECPMHQKEPPPAASGCPVPHDNSDVNPLNMVRVAFYFINFIFN